MWCSSCRRPVSLTGVFPGGQIVCPGCHTPMVVAPLPDPSSAAGVTPYRQAGAAPVELPTTDGPRSLSRAEPPPGLGHCPRCLTAELAPRGDDMLCPRCGGLFVGHARLRALVDTHRDRGLRPAANGPASRTFEGPSVSYLACPSCSEAMSRKSFGGRSAILVDVCTVHGVWLDRGELDAVIAYAFDLPEAAAARAALLGLVWQALPPPARRADGPFAGGARGLLDADALPGASRQDGTSVEAIVRWLARWLT